MPKVICKKIGCKKLIDKGKNNGYCDEHKEIGEKKIKEAEKFKQNSIELEKIKVSKKIYNSSKWKSVRKSVLIRDNYLCQDCLSENKITEANEVHHIVELNDDLSKAYDKDNLISLCKTCHNIRHNRFQGDYYRQKSNVYIVYGAPLSGKTSYVLNNMTKGDLVVDMDRIFEAITLLKRYDKSDTVKSNAFIVRDTLIDTIKYGIGNYENAWIIGGYPQKKIREELARTLNAELIYIPSNKEECLKRLKYCDDYRKSLGFMWEQYISKWFMQYEP